jgi:hypothetical protein
MRVHESIGCTISVRSRARHDIDLRGPFLRGSFHLGRGFQLMNGVDCLTTNAALGEDWWTLGPGQTRRFQFSYNAERPSHALYYWYAFLKRKGKDMETRKFRLVINPLTSAVPPAPSQPTVPAPTPSQPAEAGKGTA